jgi:surface polysaccharide O-acyltransferase-like enzyme
MQKNMDIIHALSGIHTYDLSVWAVQDIYALFIVATGTSMMLSYWVLNINTVQKSTEVLLDTSEELI